MFDQRGTGGSGLLRCRAPAPGEPPATPALRQSACAGSTRGTPGPAIRAATRPTTSRQSASSWGQSAIALFGTSYGTKLALGYARSAIPTRVDRLILDSVVQIDGPDPLLPPTRSRRRGGRSTRCAGRRLHRGDGRPESRSSARALSTRIASERSASRPASSTHAAGRGGAALRGWTSSPSSWQGDFDPTLRAALPGTVHSALGGDAAPLLRLRRRGGFEVDAEAAAAAPPQLGPVCRNELRGPFVPLAPEVRCRVRLRDFADNHGKKSCASGSPDVNQKLFSRACVIFAERKVHRMSLMPHLAPLRSSSRPRPPRLRLVNEQRGPGQDRRALPGFLILARLQPG